MSELNWSSPALHEACARFLGWRDICVDSDCEYTYGVVEAVGRVGVAFAEDWRLLLHPLASEHAVTIGTSNWTDTEWMVTLYSRATGRYCCTTRSKYNDPGLAVARAVFALMESENV